MTIYIVVYESKNVSKQRNMQASDKNNEKRSKKKL